MSASEVCHPIVFNENEMLARLDTLSYLQWSDLKSYCYVPMFSSKGKEKKGACHYFICFSDFALTH